MGRGQKRGEAASFLGVRQNPACNISVINELLVSVSFSAIISDESSIGKEKRSVRLALEYGGILPVALIFV